MKLAFASYISSMNTVNARKATQLGMPLGTATHRLRKQILFSLLERLGENQCFVCGLPMSVETLSIEHKRPWFDDDADKFWDLENIAFSHNACNRPHRPGHAQRAGHGRCATYQRGCRCDECRAWKSAKNKRDRSRSGARVVMEQAATL